jgi:hypothetical protein
LEWQEQMQLIKKTCSVREGMLHLDERT